jgi:elongation factor P
MTIELDGEPYKVLNFSIMKQARGAAKTTIKFKNLKTQNTIENTYRSGEKFETAEILRKDAQFTYADEMGNYFFMDSGKKILIRSVPCFQILFLKKLSLIVIVIRNF